MTSPIQGAKPPALNLRNLSVLAYANGFSLWVYRTHGEILDEVLAPGFFDEATMLSNGDHIHLVGPSAGAMRRIEINGHRTTTLTALR